MQDPPHDQTPHSRTGARRQGNTFSFQTREKNVLDFSSYRSGFFANQSLFRVESRPFQSGNICATEYPTMAGLLRRFWRRVNIIARRNPISAPRSPSLIE